MSTAARWLGFRLSAALLVLVALALIWTERAWFEPAAIQALLAHRPWAPLAFIGAHVLVSLCFIPRTPMAVAAGLVFGLGWGIVWTSCGALAGAAAGFALARTLGGRLSLFERVPRLNALIGRLERGGWRAVWAIRIVPIMPHSPVNYAFGLTRIGWGAYLGGSFLGLLPSTIMGVGIGAAGGKALGGGGWLVPGLVGGAALILSLALPKLLRRRIGETSTRSVP